MNGKNETGQCVISYRLLRLLQWITQHEQENLKNVIADAVKNGLSLQHEKVSKSKSNDEIDLELQQSVVDFFALLEVLIAEVGSERHEVNDAHQRLLPALCMIDTHFFDEATVHSSLESAVSKKQHVDSSHDTMKQVVFKELLKRWKPVKKPVIN